MSAEADRFTTMNTAMKITMRASGEHTSQRFQAGTVAGEA